MIPGFERVTGITTQKIPCMRCEGSGLQQDMSTEAKAGDMYPCYLCEGKGYRTGLKLVEEGAG